MTQASPVDTASMLHEATDWLLRLRDEGVTELEIAEWLAWYEQDERHKSAFDEMQAFWHQAGQLADGAEGRQRVSRLLQPPARREVWRERVRTSRSGWMSRRLTAGLAAAAVLVTLVTVMLDRIPDSRGPRGAAEFAAVREQFLPDGSRVELAPLTTLSTTFTAAERAISLDGGEAYFRVAHNRERPFIVTVAGVRVRAIGTQFNIRQVESRVVVTVTEGIVEVTPARPSARRSSPELGAVRVTAGREITWINGAPEGAVVHADVGRATAWRSGRLEYIDEPMAAVIADINRYSSRRIVVREVDIGRMTYTGTIFTGSIDEWLSAIPREFPVRITTSDDETIVGPRTEMRFGESASTP